MLEDLSSALSLATNLLSDHKYHTPLVPQFPHLENEGSDADPLLQSPWRAMEGSG